jgi:hypothetical protein
MERMWGVDRCTPQVIARRSGCSATIWMQACGDQDARRDRVAADRIVAAAARCNAELPLRDNLDGWSRATA